MTRLVGEVAAWGSRDDLEPSLGSHGLEGAPRADGLMLGAGPARTLLWAPFDGPETATDEATLGYYWRPQVAQAQPVDCSGSLSSASM